MGLRFGAKNSRAHTHTLTIVHSRWEEKWMRWMNVYLQTFLSTDSSSRIISSSKWQNWNCSLVAQKAAPPRPPATSHQTTAAVWLSHGSNRSIWPPKQHIHRASYYYYIDFVYHIMWWMYPCAICVYKRTSIHSIWIFPHNGLPLQHAYNNIAIPTILTDGISAIE